MNSSSTKTLSVIIPTYDMEEFLPRCLDSLIISEGLEQLEVWVVNDGSRDRSSAIAHQYAEKYPLVFNVIDKPNGNYGSCINAALPLCTGKYVKILDSDDYFNTQNLQRLLTDLINVDVDVVLTDVVVFGAQSCTKTPPDIPARAQLSVAALGDKISYMHHFAYKTQLLQSNGYTQTEGIFYTDNEWIFYPLFFAKTIIYFDYDVYHYWLGRDGQTMNKEVQIKNAHHLDQIVSKMLEFYSSFDKTSHAFSIAKARLRATMITILEILLSGKTQSGIKIPSEAQKLRDSGKNFRKVSPLRCS